MAEKQNELKNKLFFERKNAWHNININELKKIMSFSDEYKTFLNKVKTERQAVNFIEKISKKHSYININKAKKSDKNLFYNFNNVACALVKINNLNFENGFNIIASHIDCPRLDFKSINLFEKEEMAYIKTQYYGGIKKYQWLTRPLALHGVIVLENSKILDISIGENDNEPCFTINDLLPHLAQDQMSKSASKFIEGEQLNILVGSIPYKFKKSSNYVKLNILKLLNDKYGIKEEDIISADLELVPAGKSRDIGFDSSFIGGYGQDDRVCAYTSLKAMLGNKSNKNLICLFFDKEEIGSCNSSGADSNFMLRLMENVFSVYGSKKSVLKSLENSNCISADVTAGTDPEWKSVVDPLNDAKLGYGLSISKIGGVRGKYSSSEPSAEFVAKIRQLFNKNNIKWYPSQLGKIDQGGGGTVAKYLSYYGMNVLDCGIPLLSMHSPFEVSSKVDIFEMYKAFISFYKI